MFSRLLIAAALATAVTACSDWNMPMPSANNAPNTYNSYHQDANMHPQLHPFTGPNEHIMFFCPPKDAGMGYC